MPDEKRTWTLEQIREACMDYDRQNGKWPETRLEGRAVFAEIIDRDLTDEERAAWERETGNE